MSNWTRRSFLNSSPWLLAPLGASDRIRAAAPAPADEGLAGMPGQSTGGQPVGELASFPQQAPSVAREVVGAAHGNFARVKELVNARPALARATWDWGFGDWETALGGASHTGNRDIALYLIAHGARPTIFSAAMLGQVDVVRAFVTASPGIQTLKGPHGITLLRHANAGGDDAKAVVDYLTSVGGADDRMTYAPLPAEDRDRLLGTYVYGAGADDAIEVSLTREQLMLKRTSGTNRPLSHLGDLVFHPGGAPDVRIRFEGSTGGRWTVTVVDGPVRVVGRRAV